MSENETPSAGTPRWVKVSVIVAVALVLLLVVSLLLGVKHGPGRHAAANTPVAVSPR